MTTWNKVTKPSGTSWTALPKPTKAWNKISKASGTTWTAIARPSNHQSGALNGTPIGLTLMYTYTAGNSTTWTAIAKPTTIWTKITKAT